MASLEGWRTRGQPADKLGLRRLRLGLRLAKLLGGSIQLSSEVGVGTQIALNVPVSVIDHGSDNQGIDLRGVRVFLITPDETEAKYLADDIAYWGAEVSVLSSPDELRNVEAETALIVAAAPMESEVRQAATAQAARYAKPQRFVFFTYSIQPTDFHSPANDAITTTGRSRARFVTAIAVASGRASPEIDQLQDVPLVEGTIAPPNRDSAVSSGRLILLVEDHPLNRDVIVRQLHLLGYSVDAVENGVAALSALEQERYGLILTDCNMPEMDGFELARRIRALPSDVSRLPIIALTANVMVGKEQKCLAAGMDDFLPKPVDLKTLRQCLALYLGKGSANNSGNTEKVAPRPKDIERAQSDVLDISLLAECFGDDPKIIEENLQLFLKTMAADLRSLSSAISQRNGRDAELTAHKIKGAANFVGGHRVAHVSQVLEGLAASGDWETVGHMWPRLVEASREIEGHIARRA